ncbi:MAG: bifunctional UDP-sugar hydrolase/5'-nucleotidase [Anaerolineales bacterium]|jgi:2',3'-cyclic-nucleotide 2'-phosphodiesterase (5'-nucleotidase family)
MNETIEITIFHTNDMHGRLEAIAKLSNFARRLRRETEDADRLVFFWDAGDAADRRIQICSVTKAAAFSPILNTMGYDLQTMGNAISLPYGPQAMEDVAERAIFPILAANCRDGTGPSQSGLQDQVIIPLPGGLKIGVIGLTAPWGGLYEIFGLHFPDFLELGREMVSALRTSGIPLVIVLSHLGLEDDRRLAEGVPGIDLIIGAHSHDRLPQGEFHNDVLIVQAGEYAQSLGRVDISISPQNGELVNRSASLLDVPENEPPDPLVLEAIELAEAEVDHIKAQPVGELETDLDLNHFNECGIGNLTADVLRERLNADAAIIASGQFHTGLSAGRITFGQLDAACFSSANPCLTMVSGEQIIQALERGLDPEINQYNHHGFRGTPVGIPQISGMKVWYDENKPVGKRVKKVHIRKKSMDPDHMYKLAHTDAETMGAYGYLVLNENQLTEHEVPTIVREAIEDYLRRHSPVAKPSQGRWIQTGSLPAGQSSI